MKIVIKIFIIAIALLVTSCEEVINVDLETAEPRLVIDASIDWVKGTSGNEQKIKLSTTTGYYDASFPTVSGASIIIENSSNVIFNFIETPGTGEYICNNFQPTIGESYTLTILLNGQVYTATETLMGITNIENNIEQNNAGGFGGDEIEIKYFYQDDPAQDNFYLHRILNPRVAFPEYEIEDDQNSQGNLMLESYSNEDLKQNDVIQISLYGISNRYYNYFNKLLIASGNTGNPFISIPVAVRGNIVNQTNFQNFAFGYFRLSEVVIREYTIQ